MIGFTVSLEGSSQAYPRDVKGIWTLCVLFVPTSKSNPQTQHIWLWVKIAPPADHWFLSLVPFTRVSFWVPIYDPLPQINIYIYNVLSCILL